MSQPAFPPWPSFTQEEADAVQRVLLSNRVNYWTGQEGREFECAFAGFAGTEYAVALANGTVALDVALQALGVGPGDEVVMGAVVTKSVPPAATVVGNPARVTGP